MSSFHSPIFQHSSPAPSELPERVQRGAFKSKTAAGIAVVWFLVVLTGSLLMAQYSQTAGASGSASERWPETSQVSRHPARPELVIFIHPRCPCSRATLGELERLMADCQGLLSAQVLFIQPEGVAEDWVKTDLWRTASAIPGVQASIDHEGREARLFQAQTSGQAILYDAKGALLFQGGITLARGHAGDNPGRDAIESLLKQKHPLSASTPVFGCELGWNKTPEKCTACQP